MEPLLVLNRRSLLSSMFVLGLTESLGGVQAVSQAAGPVDAQPSDTQFDADTFRFWTEQVRQPSDFFAETGRLPLPHKGPAAPGEVEFLFFDPNTQAFQIATESSFGESGLVGSGSVTVSLSVDTIRLSTPHREILRKSGTGSLRVDVKQGQPLPLLSETLSWSAIGSFQGKAENEIHTLSFDPKSTWGGSKEIPLASGVGFWAWNFSVQKGASKWAQILQSLSGALPAQNSSKGNGAAASSSGSSGGSAVLGGSSSLGLTTVATSALSVIGVGLPAVAKTAFNTIDEIYGFLHSQGSSKPQPVFQMQDTPLLATQDARQKHHGRAVSLRPGTYVIAESAAASQIMSGKFTLMDYGLVPAGTKNSDVEATTLSTLGEVSYCVVSVDVAQAAS